jgi:hypothetical protein
MALNSSGKKYIPFETRWIKTPRRGVTPQTLPAGAADSACAQDPNPGGKHHPPPLLPQQIARHEVRWHKLICRLQTPSSRL